MSHLPERKEKVCLNCNAQTHGRYCHVCGQENMEPKEPFWVLATHFIYDITHFDGKFFSTLKYLLFKPGYLSIEYLRGKRVSYLHPIRMYVFISAVFFLIFFSFLQHDSLVELSAERTPISQEISMLEKRRDLLKVDLLKIDSTDKEKSLPELQKELNQLVRDIAIVQKDSTLRDSLPSLRDKFVLFGKNSRDVYFRSTLQYDSLQHSLPPALRDGFLKQKLIRQNLHLQEKYKHNSGAILKGIFAKFLHLFPQLLFVSLPLFALLLQLLYVRRKELYYVNHVVFTIHLYCATFIFILLEALLESSLHYLHIGSDYVAAVFVLAAMYYWYKAIRNFYRQSRKKTVMKFLLLFFLTVVLMLFLFVVFFFFSAFVI